MKPMKTAAEAAVLLSNARPIGHTWRGFLRPDSGRNRLHSHVLHLARVMLFVFFRMQIGMMFAREAPIGFLNIVERGGAWNAKQVVIVGEFLSHHDSLYNRTRLFGEHGTPFVRDQKVVHIVGVLFFVDEDPFQHHPRGRIFFAKEADELKV